MNPEEPGILYDFEIPSYVYGYYNGDTNNMGDDDWRRECDYGISPEVTGDIGITNGEALGHTTPNPWRPTAADSLDSNLALHHRYETLNRELYENSWEEDNALDSEELMSRLRNKKLSNNGYPLADNFIGQDILICVGNSEIIYEARITVISSRACSVFLEQSPNPKGRTVTAKMVGWWKLEKIHFVDKLLVKDPAPPPEKHMFRTIL